MYAIFGGQASRWVRQSQENGSRTYTQGTMPSPMLAVNERSTRYETVDPRIAVRVWVNDDSGADTGWYYAELSEWTFYEEHGWTGFVMYSVAPGQNKIGRFLAEHIRKLDGSERYTMPE